MRRSRKTNDPALCANAVACDTARTRYPEARGQDVPRFRNHDGLARTQEVLEAREAWWKAHEQGGE
jgi:very-short-patch-repair endonuclease